MNTINTNQFEKIAGKTNEELLLLAEPLIKDITAAMKKYPNLVIRIGVENLQPRELIQEIQKLTPFGKKYINNFLLGNEYITHRRKAQKEKKLFWVYFGLTILFVVILIYKFF